MSTDRLVRLGEAYGRHRGLALSTVGRLAGGHGSFFSRVADGRVTFRRVDRAIQWFSDHWPAELQWPNELPRPVPSPGAPADTANPVGTRPVDPLRAVELARECARSRTAAGDGPGARDAEAVALQAATTLRTDGRLASPAALCQALQVSRDVYYDVVRRFGGARGSRGGTRSGSDSDRMLRALVDSGDVRFALRRALHGGAGGGPGVPDAEPSPGTNADGAGVAGPDGTDASPPRSFDPPAPDSATNGAG